jgi:DNA polymerase-3 subunit delta'
MIPLVGHAWAMQLLMSGLARGRVSHATLVVGPPNIGKTTLVRTFAQALICTGPPPLPCGECSACRRVLSGNHPDVRILEANDQPIRIDQVRDLQRELSLSPYEGSWRVAVLVAFERATAEAANALLKTLEEPPGQVVLLLTAVQTDGLLPTIVSRCQVLSLRALPIAEVRDALITHWGVERKQADLLAHLSGGRLGWAVTASQDRETLARREEALEQALRLPEQTRVERLAGAVALGRDSQLVAETLAHWTTWWHDLLMLKAGAGVALCNVDRTDSLLTQAGEITLSDAQRMVGQIGFIGRCLEQNVNVRLAVEVLLLSWPRAA